MNQNNNIDTLVEEFKKNFTIEKYTTLLGTSDTQIENWLKQTLTHYGESEYQRGLKQGDWNAENLQEAYEMGRGRGRSEAVDYLKDCFKDTYYEGDFVNSTLHILLEKARNPTQD